MKKDRRLPLHLLAADDLPFDRRILNFVCLLGVCAALISLVVRIATGMPPATIYAMGVVLAAILALYCISTLRGKFVNTATTVMVFGLGAVFFPVLYFTGGGADSGMAAYFALAILLEFLLLKGKARVAALVLTVAATALTYCSTLYWGWGVLPQGGMSAAQRLWDNMQSILVVGFFLGTVNIFQTGIYLREKGKTDAASAEVMRGEELLTLVNEAATLLLTAEPGNFNAALTRIMGKLATSLDIDCVYIWRTQEREGRQVYVLLYDWFARHVNRDKSFQAISGSNVIPRMPEWDDKMLGERGYMSETAAQFASPVREMLTQTGIKAVMAFPVFFQGRYWGFVTFENRHSDRLCSDREAAILKSGSLLLANAIERNDSMRQLSERLTQQQLMSRISRSFISKEPLGDLIRNALARMGGFLKVTRVLIAVFEKNSEVSRPEYFWFADPKYTPNASQRGFSGIIKELFPRHQADIEDNPTIYCDNMLTHQGGKFKIFHERGGLKSFICAPIYVDGELWGVMSIEEHEDFRSWSESDAQLVSMVSSAISNAVARDLMEKERSSALEQALQASRAKGDFLSNMSHEIRTPMNAIIGMTSIGRSSKAADKKDYAFDKIDDASRHLLGIINDILDMSKIEANKLELSRVDFDFENMLQKVVGVINFRVDERRQQLYVHIDKDIPRQLIGDDQRLSQVITNLLSNAVKFTPEEGTIRLDARLVASEGDMCRIQIEVTDTGIGISDEQKARLFRSFEQAEVGTSRKYGGTGLGLAISKRIVELMDGEIWAQSQVGQGSTFAFTVLLQRGAKEKRRLLAEGVDWHNIRLFAVDDEPEIRDFFAETCAELGIFCTVAGDGEEAERLLAQQDAYDMYFIDWKLPGMNGVELARLVREKTRRDAVVIIFSSTDWSEIEEDARTAGVNKFLPKPLFRSSIIELINECAGAKDQAQEGEEEQVYDDFSGRTILLAEDVEINREIVAALLEPTNLCVACAENGQEALAMFQQAPEKYDMIFMDVQMPEMDGYEATQRIRALDDPRAKHIPIVAMTANVFKEDIERCLEAGMDGHVGKPLDMDEVLRALRKYLK